jgi:site-specific recombinase XerD
MNDFFNTVRSYLLEYLPKQKCYSANTVKAHKNALNLFVSYLRNEKKMKVDGICFEIMNRQMVVDFLNWLVENRGCSLASRNQRLSILRTFFDYAGQLDCTQVALELSVKKIPVAKHPQRMVEFLTESALKVLLEQPDTTKLNGLRDQFFMSLMYDTGARCSELLDLKLCDLRINITHPVAYLRGKGNKVRSVPIMPKTTAYCKHYLKRFHPNADLSGGDYLFYTIIHNVRHRMSPDAVAQFMKKYGEKARTVCPEVPMRVHPHQLRHTRAIHLYRDGVPLVLVGEYLGHVNPATTKIYAYADTEMKRKALEKADARRGNDETATPMWKDDEDMILRLSGLR